MAHVQKEVVSDTMADMYGPGDKGKATKLHSKIIRSLGECEHCFTRCQCDKWQHRAGCSMQAAHIQGRKKSATRTQLRNAFCLCASCHGVFTDKPLSFSRFVTTTWAQEYREILIQLSNIPTKVNWSLELERLKDIEKRLKANETTLEEERIKESEA